MCGHVSTSIASCVRCSCFDIVAPPLPQDHNHYHQFLPPPPPMMSNYSLFTVEAISGFGYYESCMNGGSSSCDSPSSMGSGGESVVMQRSVSNHNGSFGNFVTMGHDFVNDDDVPRSSRKESSSVWSESNAIILQGMSKAYKYSPEEMKEKIHKYRTKRNLRNFNKRIKWLVLRYAMLNLEVIQAAIRLAKQEGLSVSLDLASFEMVRNYRSELRELLEFGSIDLCFANEDYCNIREDMYIVSILWL